MNKSLIGWIVFAIGFLGAAATAMPKPPLWYAFVPFIVVSIVGALLARKFAGEAEDAAAEKAASERDPATSVEARPLLEQMLGALSKLDAEGDYEELKTGIEDIQTRLVAPFVEERRRYMQKFGPGAFAQFFGSFARGERNLNRAWSALVDEHRPEVAAALGWARQALEESLDLLDRAIEATGKAGTSPAG